MLRQGGHYGLGKRLIHESLDLASAGQHDLRIKALNKAINEFRELSKLSLNICIH